MDTNTICAVSTPAGQGGIAVIRISGEKSFEYCDRIFVPGKSGSKVVDQPAYTLQFGTIQKDQEIIDEVLVAAFRAPHSFTGENTVEITCHGSTYIQQEIQRLLIANGCRLAAAGEFTQRAFLNGKMDLSQAEAVADLITAASSASHRLAINQMRGGFSSELLKLRSQLLDFVSLIELELDFSEEDVEFADRHKLIVLAENIQSIIRRLANSFSTGNAIKNGIPVAIVGETNAGKSTLLNHLLNEERAIVSEIHGTTRDVIEDVVNIHGILFRFIDTAGIRETGDEIETMGIERTFRKIEQASIVVWMIDSTQFSEKIDKIADQIVPRVQGKKLIIVFNKVDKIDAEEQFILEEEFLPDVEAVRIYLSAKFKKNTEELEKALLAAANLPELGENDLVVTNLRHFEALTRALSAIDRVVSGINDGISGDFLSQDIRECMHYLGEITGGEITTDEVLGNIFSKFCVGK